MSTLVLNRVWQIDRIVSWQSAMRLLISGRAEVIESHSDEFIRTVTMIFQVPSVIRMLSGRVQTPNRVRLNKHAVWNRDKGQCQYCERNVAREDMTYDHVLPRSRGGKTVWSNIVLSCESCNQAKGDRTPSEAGMKLAAVPKIPRKDQLLRSMIQGSETWRKYGV